jgi:transporter family protein
MGFVLRKYDAFDPATFGGKAWVFIFLSALAGAASWICYFIALRTGPAGAVAVIDKLSVVLVLVFAALALGEAFTVKSAAGLVLTVAGTLLILFK